MPQYNKRDDRIDILRGIAILCIILDHSKPAVIICQIRNFDVIMMAFLVGTSFYLSNYERKFNYIKYIIKRFKRLILPTWKFLIFFFLLFLSLSVLLKHQYYFPIKQIIRSFIMLDGIGFVWIMRVFFIVAIFSPIWLYVNKKIGSNLKYFGVLIVTYAFYCILLFINYKLAGNIQKLFQNYIVEGVGYSLVSAIGIRLYKLRKKQILGMSFVFLIIFIVLMIYHKFSVTQTYKYPPTMYYLSYGLFVSLWGFYLLSFDFFKNLFYKKHTIYLSKISLKLYFAHIIPFYIINLFGKNMPIINYNFITRFLFLLVCGLALVYTYNSILFEIIKHRKIKSIKL